LLPETEVHINAQLALRRPAVVPTATHLPSTTTSQNIDVAVVSPHFRSARGVYDDFQINIDKEEDFDDKDLDAARGFQQYIERCLVLTKVIFS
jgi:hypothetical protein